LKIRGNWGNIIIVEFPDMKPETDLKSILAKAISISTAKEKQAGKNIFVDKKEMSL
jgi:hypothetical protein